MTTGFALSHLCFRAAFCTSAARLARLCFLDSFLLSLLTVHPSPAPQRSLSLPHGRLSCDRYMLRSGQTAHASRPIGQPGSHRQATSHFTEGFRVSFTQARGEPADRWPSVCTPCFHKRPALAGVSSLSAPPGHTARRAVLGHTLNTLRHAITHTKKSHRV